MEKYINKKIYTDIESYRIYDIDEKKGTAMAIAVEKRIRPQMVEGGFSAICLNNEEFNRTNEVFNKEGAVPFKIILKKGVWGYMRFKPIFSFPVKAIRDIDQFMADNPRAEIEENSDGDKFVTMYEKTSKGKRAMTFEKLGVLEDVCRYYYDYNF